MRILIKGWPATIPFESSLERSDELIRRLKRNSNVLSFLKLITALDRDEILMNSTEI